MFFFLVNDYHYVTTCKCNLFDNLIIQEAFKIKNKRIDTFLTVIHFYNWIYILWMLFI